MVIAGAGGHAKEVLGIFAELNSGNEIVFFDDVLSTAMTGVLANYDCIKTLSHLHLFFNEKPDFVLGVGKPAIRKKLADKLISVGGKLRSIISPHARIGQNVSLGAGLNIMTGAVITQDVTIGTGTLVHINVTIHHDCTVGDYCELSPSCHVLGKVKIGNETSVGAGAVILPGISIGSKVTIGAGAVVTKNVDDNAVLKGIPAK